jgi:hypothetical protein
MSKYKLIKFKNLERSSNISNKSGQISREPKYELTFLNTTTDRRHTTNDVIMLKGKRDKIISSFYMTYERLFLSKTISIMSFVVYEKDYSSVSKFLNTISSKLRRKNIDKLGYFWLRDVGEIEFKPHFHILMAISRISQSEFDNMFLKKTQKFKIQFQKTKKGLKTYLSDKELFGRKGQRTFGRSKVFKKK